MKMRPIHTSIVNSLVASTPFVGPEALERRTGRPIELRLGANESPFGASPLAIAAMRDQALVTHNYGDPEAHELRQALSLQLGVPMASIVLGAGIDELLGLSCRIFLEPNDAVVTTFGSYPTFDYGASACGPVFHRVPYANQAPDLPALLDAVKGTRAKVVYLANPDNPSGAWWTPDEIDEFRQALPYGCVLLLDEAYYEYAAGYLPLDADDPQVIRFRTFSKAHGMAGMRIAYVVAHKDHTDALNKIRYHFGVNSIAQAGALASLSDPAHIAQVVAQTDLGRIELREFMVSMGLKPLPSHTNFLTVDVGSKSRAESILEALLQQGVFIRKPGLPPLDSCIRITIGRPEQRARFAQILTDVLRTL